MTITLRDLLPEPPPDEDHRLMREALGEALLAAEAGEVPVGAVIVRRGEIIARAHNRRETLADPTAHAEILAITRAAKALGDWRLEDTALYVTLEPCPMCAGAVLSARVPRVCYGARDPKAGACHSLFGLLSDPRLNHRAELRPDVYAEASARLLREFFRERRGGGSD